VQIKTFLMLAAPVVGLAAVLNVSAADAADDSKATAAPAAEAADAAPVKFSEAETLLWRTDQLKDIKKPTRLKYEFKKGGSLEKGFTDSVVLNIVKVKPDGMKAGNLQFFTGERHHYVPPYENIDGNPVLSIYLEGDVYEMKRLTGGSWIYFQKRIKRALAENAQVTPVTVTYDGREVQAKQVTISPYATDPRAQRTQKYHRFANKKYVFTVSDEIPGYLYEIQTTTPAEQSAGANAAQPSASAPKGPLLEETLKLVEVDHKPTAQQD